MPINKNIINNLLVFIIKHKSYLDPYIILSVLHVIGQIQTGSCKKRK